MHIDWLKKATPHGETILRSWLLQQAFDDATERGELIDPLVVEHLLTGSLAALWQTAWETTYKGNEEAALEALGRYSIGRSKRFLVTVHSQKHDGLAMVIIDVPDKEAAFRKVARIWSEDIRETWVYLHVTHEFGESDMLVPEGYTEENVRNDYEEHGGPNRLFEMYAAPLHYDQNLPGAAAW